MSADVGQAETPVRAGSGTGVCAMAESEKAVMAKRVREKLRVIVNS
jgi:hypothetical protein